MPHWIPLITSSLRLVDLVDSAHELGAPPSFSRETRRGRTDGLWINIGVLLLEYLAQQSMSSSHDYVSIADFCTEILQDYPSLCEDDVYYVCAVLATPCEASLPDPDSGRNIQTKETNLIEQLRHGKKRFRLTASGRLAISLATNITDLLYANEDAAKIVKALQYGDYTKALEACHEMRSQIVGHCHNIRRAITQPGYDDTKKQFFEQQEMYMEVIKNVQSTVRKAKMCLSTDPEIEDRLEAWGANHPDRFITISHLSNALTGLIKTLHSLGDIFAEFIQEAIERSSSKIGLVDFAKQSTRLLLHPPKTEQIQNLWRSLGPCASLFAYASPSDFRGCLRKSIQEKSESRLTFSTEGTEAVRAMPSQIVRLLEQHGAAIFKEIKKGPLSLQKAFQKGWFLQEQGSQLFGADIVGVYALPKHLVDHLRMGETVLGVGIREGGSLNFESAESHITGTDLVLLHL